MDPIRRYDTIDSTNLAALRLARSGERGPLWIVAREQTTGRGRCGRRWMSASGNLFATWLIAMSGPRPAELGFVAALAVADTVAQYAPAASIALKWPNDVLAGGRKLAGILLEREGVALAVGIGINCADHPTGTEFPAASLAQFGPAPEADAVLARLAAPMSTWYEVWLRDGFAPIRREWRARAFGLGTTIVARTSVGDMVGVFEDLDEDGAIVIRAGGIISRITAADVFFGVP
jgi:BirA family transcriptional regulator, biotin operon repressor / biotin---[acetyl-CoA-carboxylase] ligase